MPFTTIITRYSLISGTIPNGASFQDGELALNIGPGDGTLYYKVSGSTQMLPIRAGSSSYALVAGSGGGGGSALTVQNQGVPLSTAVTNIDFVGPGVSASLSGSGVIRVTILTGSTTWGAISGIPVGLVSSSAQINTGSFTGSFFGVFAARQHISSSLDAAWDIGTAALRFRTLFVQNVSSSTPIASSSWAAFALSASWAPPAPGQVVEVRDENIVVTSTLTVLNFTGAGVSSSLSGSVVNVIIPGGGGGGTALEIQDENVPVTASVGVLNFTGAGVTAAVSGGVVNVTIPGGGGGSALEVRDEGISLTTTASILNFVGPGVTATLSGSVVNVEFSGSVSSLGRGIATVTTPSIAPNQTITGSIATFGKSYVLLTVDTSTDSRIRLYGSASFRATDLTRSIGVDPITENGLMVDLVLSGSPTLFNFALSPVVNGGNIEPTPAADGYYSITNLSAASASITVNFNRIVLES